MNMHTGIEYAEQACNPKYEKLTYAQCDCQAFCELVLKDIGVRNENGKPYNWRGSNHIAREACSWLGTVDECIKTFGDIPMGAWAFIWADDGGEKKRGYYDGKGNYKHIGIYVGFDTVMDSTRYKSGQRDGPGKADIKRFNRIGIPSMLDFSIEDNYNDDGKPDAIKLIAEIRAKLDELEGVIKA